MGKRIAIQTDAERTQFVFVRPCGCPIGLIEGSYGKTEDGAWDRFADDRADERRLRNAGVRVLHMSHVEYREKWYPRMVKGCTHGRADS